MKRERTSEHLDSHDACADHASLAEVVIGATQRLEQLRKSVGGSFEDQVTEKMAAQLFDRLAGLQKQDKLVVALREFLRHSNYHRHIPIGMEDMHWIESKPKSILSRLMDSATADEKGETFKCSLVLTKDYVAVCQVPAGMSCDYYGSPGSALSYREVGAPADLKEFVRLGGDIGIILGKLREFVDSEVRYSPRTDRVS